jgi:pimeloyl-ACP methyl ester carboxylesterase
MEDKNIASDLRGAGRLTIDAVTGITDIVENLHHTIASIAGIFGEPDQQKTTGITGLVYRNVRAVTELVGSGIDSALKNLVPLLGEMDSSPGREALLSALNGVLGDYLAASDNPLAINMKLRRDGAPLPMDDQTLSSAVLEAGGKLAIMVHGSCMNDLQWNRKGHEHGAALARDLGYLPVYLHYNTGLHISENGKLFSDLMETFIKQLPQPLELVIVAHSMGGLVSRSACHYGKLAGHNWLNNLRKIIFLGTPHHGAPLERGGNWIDVLLEINPYSAPFSRLGKIRSAGITDLRYGNLLDVDWKERDRFEHTGDIRVAVPLPDGVQCYAMAVTLAKESNLLGDTLIGDGLVTLNSALGRHENAALNLSFPEIHQWLGYSMGHLDLLNQPEVYENMKLWLKN